MKIKKPKAPSKKTLRSRADRLLQQRATEAKYCLLCGVSAQVGHHYFPKNMYGHLRYDLDNIVPLCNSCHFIIENRDTSLAGKIALIKGKVWYERLKNKAREKTGAYQTVSWYKGNIEKLTK